MESLSLLNVIILGFFDWCKGCKLIKKSVNNMLEFC